MTAPLNIYAGPGALATLKEHGFYPLLFKAVTIDILLIYLLPAGPREQAINRLHHALEDGALRCPVDTVLPLSEAARAHELVEAGQRSGAVLLDCQG